METSDNNNKNLETSNIVDLANKLSDAEVVENVMKYIGQWIEDPTDENWRQLSNSAVLIQCKDMVKRDGSIEKTQKKIKLMEAGRDMMNRLDDKN